MQIEYDHKIEISIPRFLDLESKLLDYLFCYLLEKNYSNYLFCYLLEKNYS